jgi:hypothetical protein
MLAFWTAEQVTPVGELPDSTTASTLGNRPYRVTIVEFGSEGVQSLLM